MLWALLLAASSGDPFARARADVVAFCQGRPAGCAAEQRRQLGHFATMMAGFSDPGQRTARRCMIAGKRGRFVDWTVAVGCMRKAVTGRRVGQ